jgi:hypothetical protein
VDVLPYDDHDRAVKLLHSLDRTIWDGKFEAIVESEKYDTLMVNELFSKIKSAEVDRGMTAKLDGPTDSYSLALVGGSKGKANTNPSTGMFSLSSLMSMPDEEFDVLGEDELALLTRRVNMRRNTRTSFQCGKPGHFFTDCPEKVENKDVYKNKSRNDGKYWSRRDHKIKYKNKHKDERRSRKKESRGNARAMV